MKGNDLKETNMTEGKKRRRLFDMKSRRYFLPIRGD
jgi:hypothetical protein